MHRLLILVVQLLLWQFLQTTGTTRSFDGFQRPVEIPTARQYLPGPIRMQRTAGRTRQRMLIDQQNVSFKGKMVDNYCCFWVYQKHPAIPERYEHRPEYPFDFLLNGVFLKNQRNYIDDKAAP